MKKIKYIISLLVLSTSAFAQEIPMPVTWTPPTTYEDGNPIPPGDLKDYRVYCGHTPTEFPYELLLPDTVSGVERDMSFCLQGVTYPITVYVALTVSSIQYNTESELSNVILRMFDENGYINKKPEKIIDLEVVNE